MKTMLKKMLFFMLMLPLGVLAQNTLKGKVVNSSNGQPLASVTVSVKGTATATQTDDSGSFVLKNIKNGATLNFAFIGFKAESLVYSGQKEVTVQLTEENKAIEEVVVQVGYGAVKKKDATGAVDVVTAKDFNRGFQSNTEGLLNGRVAGVVITQGGRPGDGAAIRIRGGASLNASNDPLIVLDGMPLGNTDLSSINPNDIESFSILKDASATAIYGNRGSNGVILITTKKGAKGDIKVNMSTTFTVNTLAKKVNTTSAADFRAFMVNPANISAYGIDPARVARMGNANTDWQDQIFSNSVTVDNNISMRGAMFKSVPTSFSFGNSNIPGILNTSSFNRTTSALRMTPSFFKDHLKVAVNANYSLIKERFADEGAISDAINFDPTQPVYSANSPFGGYNEWMNGASPILLATDNPVAKLNQRSNYGWKNRYYGNIQLDYKFHFLPELKATVIAGLDRTSSNYDNKLSNQSINGYLVGGNPLANGGSYAFGWGRNTQKVFDAYLNYSKVFGDISVDVTAGHSYQERAITSFNSGDMSVPTNTINSLNTYRNPTSKLESYFGRANLGYKEKYLLTLNVRNDMTNNFSKANRSAFFPGMAAAWVASKEDFLAGNKTLTNLKVRFGWGVTGQQDMPTNFSYIPQYTTASNGSFYTFGNTIISPVSPQFYSETIKWEETTTTNVGVDYELFGKVRGTVDVYKKHTKDLLAYVAYPDGANLSNYGPRNFGDLEIKGIELSLNTDLIKSKDLNWNVNFNANYQDRKITATAIDGTGAAGFTTGGIAGGVGNTIQIHSTGYAPNSFWVYEQVYGTNGKPLEGVYVDRNGDGNIDTKDMYQYKKPYADFTFGLLSNLSYKHWDFSMSWRASLGNYMYDNISSSKGYLANSVSQITPLNNINPSFFDSGFVAEGNNRYFSDYYIKDASFIKLDNISLAYNLPNALGKATNVKFNFGVQNALVLTKYKGIDPEIFSGIDNTIYPRARMFVLGCNVNF